MHRLLALVTALALLVAMPAAAAAGRPTKFTEHTVGITCAGLGAVSGGGFVFFGANTSEEFEPDAFVDYWTTSTPIDAPDLFHEFGEPVDVTWDGSVLSGSISLVDQNGDAAGAATFSATLVPVGDLEPFDDQFRDGNHQHSFTGVSQPMDPSGTLTVGTSTFSLDGCFADMTTITVFETNPRSFVARFSDHDVDCELTNSNGDSGFLFISIDKGDVFIDAGASPAGGTTGTGAFGEGTLVHGVLDATLSLYDPETGEPVPGEGSIHLEIVGSSDSIDYILKYATGRETVQGVFLDIEGILTIDGMSFDLGPCVGRDINHKFIDTFPNGPKPGGKPPANDLPSGAKLLTVGSRTTIATKGASPTREAPFECLIEEENGQVFEVPVGHTVWYRIVGTGGLVTIDTAGSDYDTVAAVYTSDGAGGLVPVPDACVDDVPVPPIGRTLQAAVTWQTVAGTSYYVQIGGFPQSFEYGNLRVAVR